MQTPPGLHLSWVVPYAPALVIVPRLCHIYFYIVEILQKMANIVYIGTSLDGYIAAADGTLDWMETVPNPEGSDLGFSRFMERIDAVVMGRKTFETVVGFGFGWHYPKPGIILSSTLDHPPAGFDGPIEFMQGQPSDIVEATTARGFSNLYIDGGLTIQRFLQEDLIDELIITEIPILLGGGDRLFGKLDQSLVFELIGTEVLLNQLVKKHYRRKRM